MKMSDSVKNIFPAYIKARLKMAPLYKDKDGYKFKYVDLPQIVEAINTATHPNELAFLQLIGKIKGDRVSVKDNVRTSGGDVISVENMLIHTSGEWISKTAQVLIDDKMPSRIQCSGASVTYARRISALGFWFISAEDEIEKRGVDNRNSGKVMSEVSPLDALKFYISASSVPSKTEKAIIDSFNGKLQSIDEMNIEETRHWCNVLSRKLSESK
jgi:hypothetical protein